MWLLIMFTVGNPNIHSIEFNNLVACDHAAALIVEFQYEAILSVMAKLGKYGQDVRVVFWFDN